MNRTELTKLKKQASQIAELKGQSVDDIIGECLQSYIQDNIGTVLEDYAKIKAKENKQTSLKENQTATQSY
jgi:hypothetical protein